MARSERTVFEVDRRVQAVSMSDPRCAVHLHLHLSPFCLSLLRRKKREEKTRKMNVTLLVTQFSLICQNLCFFEEQTVTFKET